MTTRRRSTARTARAKPGEAFAELVAIMARLRSPRGCPWDREQDHRSLRQCLLEEAYEVLEAIDADDPAALRQELGDVLLQVLFHAQLASEEGRFDIVDVMQGLHEKLVKRHPHVFGDKVIETAEGVLAEWHSIKQEEMAHTPAQQIGAVPRTLPALVRAQKTQRRAERAGWKRSANDVHGAVERCLSRLATAACPSEVESVIGELLFGVADLARTYQVDAEQALRERVNGFVKETTAALLRRGLLRHG
jgi:tetrapyrrole methylase family protein/MazG family protein